MFSALHASSTRPLAPIPMSRPTPPARAPRPTSRAADAPPRVAAGSAFGVAFGISLGVTFGALLGLAFGGRVGAQTPAECAGGAAAAPAGPPPIAIFAYDRAAPLDVRDSLVHKVLGVAVHAVSFASPKGGRAGGLLYVPTARAPGRPDARGRFAGVVLLHGAPSSHVDMAPEAFALARAGAVALAIDAPFARRDVSHPLAFTPQDSSDIVQEIVDLQRAVDLLAARPDVAPERLGALGISYGGAMGALLAGVESRIAAYALVVGDGGPAAHFTDAAGRRAPPTAEVPAPQWCRWYDSMEPLAGTRFLAARPAGRTQLLFQWGRRDEMVRPYVAERLWRAAPEPKEARWYDGGHGLTTDAVTERHRWLGARLGLAPPPTFAGNGAAYVGAYRGDGPPGAPPLELRVVADSPGQLAVVGPLVPPGGAGRLRYVGRDPGAGDEVFQLDATLLTFTPVRGGGVAVRVEAPLYAPRVHLLLTRVARRGRPDHAGRRWSAAAPGRRR